MESHVTKGFLHDLKKLPPPIRKAAISSYKRFEANYQDEDLFFKRIKKSMWSVRVIEKNSGDTGYRAMGLVRGDIVIWDFIGDHDLYKARIMRMKGN